MLNLGILAHVDAGKTSLTERLLHHAGVIDRPGSVDGGDTRTDTMALERRRGITIRSAVVSFAVGDVTVNLIDTPGHCDFIAEVERALAVLDGAVLVVSAAEGVQAQTRVLMRTLRRLRIPTLLFVNKIDRGGADPRRVLADLGERLVPTPVPMGTVRSAGTRAARYEPFTGDEPSTDLLEALADHDDALLSAWVDGHSGLTYPRLRAELAAQTAAGLVHPVYFGSAITGAGVSELTAGITELLPAAGGDPHGPVSGTVFKVDRGPAGEKITYVRMFSGTLRVRDRLPGGRITGIDVFDAGTRVPAASVPAGRIATLRGLPGLRVGDPVGTPARRSGTQFSPPTLETVVDACDAADRGRLHTALTELAEQDPLIGLRRDELRAETHIRLYGEIQKQVIGALLAEEYGIDVTFRPTTTICREVLTGVGEAVEVIDVEPNPFLATVGLRVEPAPVGAGVTFRLAVELGSMPYAFIRAVEDTARKTLREGLYGWEIADCVVTMTHSGYWARQSHAHGTFDKSMSSTAGDFRNLTPLVLAAALRRAGTRVYEPMHRFCLEIPADSYPATLPALAALRAVVGSTVTRGSGYVLDGEIPAARVHDLESRLPELAHGEGVLECAFERYRPVTGAPPRRPRTDNDPLDRRRYLLRVVRRVAGGTEPDPAR